MTGPTTAEINRRISARNAGMTEKAVEAADLIEHGVAAGVIGTQASLFSTVLSAVWQMFLLPAAAIFGVFSAILSWRIAALNRNEGFYWVKATIDTLFAGALIAASVGAIVATVAFSVAAPAIYAAAIAGKALFNFGAAIYFQVMHRREAHKADPDPDKLAEYKGKAKSALVEGLVGTVISGAIAAITFIASPVAYIGALAAWTIAATVGVFWSVKEYHRQKQEREMMLNMTVETNKPANSDDTTKTLTAVLNRKKSAEVAAEQEAGKKFAVGSSVGQSEERGVSVLRKNSGDVRKTAAEERGVSTVVDNDEERPAARAGSKR